jgi:hypothetical protein
MTLDVKFGFGRVDITPIGPHELFGRGGPPRISADIKSRLEANFGIMRSLGGELFVLIALDTLYSSNTLETAICRELREEKISLAPANILTIASHTHNAPALDGTKPHLGRLEPKYLDFVARRIASSLAEAMNSLKPSTYVAHGSTPCTASVYRRRSVAGINLSNWRISKKTIMAPAVTQLIDQRVKVFIFRDDNYIPICVIWSWPCHPVSETSRCAISSDYPGHVREVIRHRLGVSDLPVVFAPGFSGDIRPYSRSMIPIHRSGKWITVRPRFSTHSKRYAAFLQSSITNAVVYSLENSTILGAQTKAEARQEAIEATEIFPSAVNIPPVTVDRWHFGPLRLIAVSGEMSNSYQSACQDFDVVTGCARQCIGYLPTAQQVDEGGYEGGGFTKLFSLPGNFSLDFERRIRNAISV